MVLMLVVHVQAGEKKEQKKEETRKGKVIGTLVNKGPAFIEVKADGEEKGRRYIPHWVGGAPDKGGGPDKAVVKLIKDLKVGSRVEVVWEFEEHFRVLGVKVLRAPDGGEKKDGPKKEEAATGRTTGILVAKGDKFIEVRGDGEEKARKYYAHYLKGPPPGFDKQILQQFDKLHLESRLLLEWIQTNHGPQVVRLEVLKDAKGKEEKTSRVVGILTGKGKGYIELKADGDAEARKYLLHFGGTPKLLKAIHDTPIGSRVQVDWLFFEHRRVMDMEVVRTAEKK